MSRRMYVVVIFILWVGVVLTVPASAGTGAPIRGGVSSPSVTLDGGAVIAGRMARAVRKTQRAERIKKREVQRAKRRAVHRAKRRAAKRAAQQAAQQTTVQSAKQPMAQDADACGPRLPKEDGTYWSCTFVDDFAGTSLDTTKWLVMTTETSGFSVANECYVDDPDNVEVSDGALRLTVRRSAAAVSCPHLGGDPEATTDLTAGMVTSYGRFAQSYGRFAFRAMFPETLVDGLPVAGVQSALWLWPQDQAHYGSWPGSGEIDVAEFYSSYPDRLIPFLHYTPLDASAQVTNNQCLVPNLAGEFHDIVLEWTPTTMSISYDAMSPCVQTGWRSVLGATAPFDQPFFMSLTQGLGLYGNALSGATVLPATMVVDSVKVWM